MSEFSTPSGSVRPGQWRLQEAVIDSALAKVTRGTESVQLDRSSLLVLQRLLEEAGQAVDKEILLKAGWPDRTVTENSLTKAIGRLRQALGDESGQWLRVVHGYGYQLVGAEALPEPLAVNHPAGDPAVPVPAVAPRTRRRPVWLAGFAACLALGVVAYRGFKASTAGTAQASTAPPSLALLPLADLSPDQDQRHFADGLTDQLGTSLLAFQPIQVAGRSATFPLRAQGLSPGAVGARLKVQMVLDGSVRREGERIRVEVHLLDTRTGYLIWAETYDRPFSDLFNLQDEIIRALLGKLRVQLKSPGAATMAGLHTRNPAAYERFLYANTLVAKDDEAGGRRALRAYEQAVALDPGFYEAWLGLADGHALSTYAEGSEKDALAGKRKAREALDRAIAVAPDRPEAWLLRGDFRYAHWWDWSGGAEDLEQGAKLGARRSANYLLRLIRLRAAQGHLEEAISLARRASQVDPAMLPPLLLQGYHLTALERYQEAEAVLSLAVRQSPTDEHGHYYLGLGKLLQGRAGEALQHFEDSASVHRLTGQVAAYHALGDPQRSDQALDMLRQRYGHVYPYNVANAYAFRGEKDKAFLWLDRACDTHDASIMYLLWDPLLRNLHGDPRFKAVLKRVNLPPTPIPS